MSLRHRIRVTKGLHVSFDEGGVRLDHDETPVGYVPFALLSDVSLASRRSMVFARTTDLVLEAEGERLVLELANGVEPLDAQRVLLAELASRPRVAAPDLGAGPYREGAERDEVRVRLLADAHAPIAERARAAHALLGGGDDGALASVVEAFHAHAMPPLVLCASFLTPVGRHLVAREVARWLDGYLTAEERAEIAAWPRFATDDVKDEARAREAIRVARARLAGASDAASQTRKARIPSRFVTTGSAGGAAWVGRSWAL